MGISIFNSTGGRDEVSYTLFMKLITAKFREALINLIGEERTLSYLRSGKPLLEYGICFAITKKFIDPELQKIHPDVCVLETDSYDKFKSDIEREFKNAIKE